METVENAWFASRDRSGGFFLAAAPHLLDRLLWYFGAPTWVAGHVHVAVPEVALADGSRLRCDAPDSFHALVSFAERPLAVVQCAPRAAAGTGLRLEIHGTDGSLLLSGDPVGATVKIADADGTEAQYQIVGEDEADTKSGLISVNSPIARALIGRKEGDVVEVSAPGGTRELEILGVEYV